MVVETGEKGARVEPFVDWDHLEHLRLVDYALPGILKIDERVIESDGATGGAAGGQ